MDRRLHLVIHGGDDADFYLAISIYPPTLRCCVSEDRIRVVGDCIRSAVSGIVVDRIDEIFSRIVDRELKQWELAKVRVKILLRVGSQDGERKRWIACCLREALRHTKPLRGPQLVKVEHVECRNSSSKHLIGKLRASIDQAIDGLYFALEIAAARDHLGSSRRIFATSLPSLNTSAVGPPVDLAERRTVYFHPSFSKIVTLPSLLTVLANPFASRFLPSSARDTFVPRFTTLRPVVMSS